MVQKEMRAYIPAKADLGQLAREGFRYDRRQRRLVCPKGKYSKGSTPHRNGGFSFYFSQTDCRRCRRRPSCAGETRKRKVAYLKPDVHQHRPRGLKRAMRLRKTVERLFGESKTWHCLGRSRYTSSVQVSLPLDVVRVGGSRTTSIRSQYERRTSNRTEHLSEAVREAGESFRASHQTKITQTTEIGTEHRTTRKLRNANKSRTLSLDVFEVLESYSVTTRVDPASMRPCLLIPNPYLGPFDLAFVLRFRDVLTRGLRSRAFQDGLAAARILAAHEWYERRQHLGRGAPVPGSPGSDRAGVQLDAAVNQVRESLSLLRGASFEGILRDLAPPVRLPSEQSKREFHRCLWWSRALRISPGLDAAAEAYLDGTASVRAERDRRATALQAFADILPENFWTRMNDPSLLQWVLSHLPRLLRPLLEPLIAYDDAGLRRAMERAENALAAYFGSPAPVVGSPGAEGGPVPALPPFDDRELAEAHADLHALLNHLEQNGTYYCNLVWQAEDPNARFERLRGYGDIVCYVENVLLGFVGDKAVYPLRVESLPGEFRRWLGGH